jgi:hypothetical protein
MFWCTKSFLKTTRILFKRIPNGREQVGNRKMAGMKIKCYGTKEQIDEVINFLSIRYNTVITSDFLENKKDNYSVFVVLVPKEKVTT